MLPCPAASANQRDINYLSSHLVQGVRDESWADYFAGLDVRCDRTHGAAAGPVTSLTGQVIDQAMLLGVINGLYTLGLPLVAVE